MANIQENLNILSEIKTDIKTAIINKGVDAGDDITVYGDKIREISGGEVDDTDYLCFEAIEDSAVSLSNFGNNAPNIEYSFDKKNWVVWDYDNIDLPTGSKIYFRGDNPTGFSHSTSISSRFVMTGKISSSGYLNSLLDSVNFKEINTIPAFSFANLFINCTSLIEAPILSGTILNERSYSGTFANTGIIKCPEIPYTYIELSSLGSMFANCKELLYGPSILPATIINGNYGYQWMFNSSSKLIKAPYLPATTLSMGAYDYMFLNCSSLQYIKAEFTVTPGINYTTNWVNGVASTGCFIKGKTASWTTKGVNACPTGWTLITSVS